MKKRLHNVLGIIQLFVALGALPAGYLMILTPDGSRMGMNPLQLSGSPFHDFLLPGLFLFIVDGIFNLISAFLSFRNSRFTGLTGLGSGIILLLWILIQVSIIGLNSILQPAFFILGILETALATWWIRLKRDTVTGQNIRLRGVRNQENPQFPKKTGMAERTSCFDQLTVIYKAQGMTRALFGSGHPLSGLFWHWLTNSSCREVSTPHKVLEFKDSFRRLLNGRELHFYSSCSGR